ncbi:MAG: beta-ketoacyl synthase N-terminal-like domain-containing protein [Mycobacterium sp.]|uniref:beta-ketoacyl synthase N-terminal-like domain-containing protein n=1 Tax=Mycobacterium sp. TaxID=1785 RepID=UPI003F9E900E
MGVSTTSESLGAAPANAIAVVGMAGRFPGANSVSAFWDNLRRGEESIATLSAETLSAAGIGDEVLANPAYVRRAPLLDGPDEFDADFFGFTPQAARMTDPQHRLFLQCAWHALEDAGCDPARFDGSIGVYGTSSASGYLAYNLLSHRSVSTIMGQGMNIDLIGLTFQNDKDFLATRVSHQFNLRGPSMAVQTACSSSLVAVHLACQSLLNGECDMALAGGVSIRIPHHVGYWYEPGSIVSPAGHCRPFDVRADGTVFGSGVAVVALKPLQAAIDDGDRIHAVIRGSAVNNDGSMKIGYAAPNPAAQADVIAEALAVADVDPSSISYVEAHGTGTPLGDPVEIEGLRRAFGVSDAARSGPCILGSVKSNVGHLEVASGIAGLIKTILCLQHRAIPATLHFTSPNPELHLDQGPFTVGTEYSPWEWDGIRRAGVSSFGVGGTNVHVVLEEAPQAPARQSRAGSQVLLLSARTAEGLRALRSDLAAKLAGPDAPDLSDVAFTLAGRRTEKLRVAAVVHDHEHAARVLEAAEHDNVFEGESVDTTESGSRVVFLFPGQGAQHAGMARGLYESEPVFAENFDRCAAGFRDELGIDLRAEVFEGRGANLARTDHAQPALFAVEYALAALASCYAIRPAALAGHSIGEYVAATLAGVFDLPTAITAVSARARLMHAAPRGVMLAVALSSDDIAEQLPSGLDIAAVNDPGNCVVSGAEEAMRELEDRLAQQGVLARRMRTSHAFHSSSMDSVLPEFEEILRGLTLRAPHTPLLSNTTGTWMTADEATDPARWARQIRATVKFSDQLDAVLADPHRVLVEVGPGGSLTASAARQPRWSDQHRAVRLMRHQLQNRDDRDAFLLALGQLWSAEVDADWTRLRTAEPVRVTLPGYPFARQKHWVDPRISADLQDLPIPAATTMPSAATNGSHAANGGAASRQQQIQATLQRIWAQSLGIDSIDPNADFFELGGDSVSAIGIANNLVKEGLDLSPQDLFQHHTVAGLAAVLAERYGAEGLGGLFTDAENPPVPPNISYFLERGLREAGRWCVPLILRLSPEVSVEDVRAVLTAVINHHDALRLQIVERAGTWEQSFPAQQEFTELSTRSLPDDAAPGSGAEREAVLAILAELVASQDAVHTPMAAVYIGSTQGGPCYLAITVHHLAGDNVSREIVATDIFTAFGQRLAGEDIALEPVSTTWREWSARCAALATHPAVLESRDFWLENAGRTTLRLGRQEVTDPPHADDLVKMSSVLSSALTVDVDEAQRRVRVAADEILLAALGRTIAHTVGEGVVAVDLAGHGRLVLKPDVDLHRTVGWFTTIYPVPVNCVAGGNASATETLDDIHRTLDAVPHYGIGHGLLRYVYAPTARQLAAQPSPNIFFSYVGTIPELPPAQGPVQFDIDPVMLVSEIPPGLGHALELRVYRSSGVLHTDWWFDTRRLETATVEDLMAQFPVALTELIQESLASTDEGDEMAEDYEEFALVDLSSLDNG